MLLEYVKSTVYGARTLRDYDSARIVSATARRRHFCHFLFLSKCKYLVFQLLFLNSRPFFSFDSATPTSDSKSEAADLAANGGARPWWEGRPCVPRDLLYELQGLSVHCPTETLGLHGLGPSRRTLCH